MRGSQNIDKVSERNNQARASKTLKKSRNPIKVENIKPDPQVTQIASNSEEKLETAVEETGSASDSFSQRQTTDANVTKKSTELSYFEKLFRKQEAQSTPRSQVAEASTKQSPDERKLDLNSSSRGYKSYVLEVFSTKAEELESTLNRMPGPDESKEGVKHKEAEVAGTLKRSVGELATVQQPFTEEQAGSQWRSIEELTDAPQVSAAKPPGTRRRPVEEFIVTQQPLVGKDSDTQRRSVKAFFNQDRAPEIRVTTSVNGPRSVRADQVDSTGRKSKGYKEYILEVYSTKEDSEGDEPSKASALFRGSEREEARKETEIEGFGKVSAYFEEKEKEEVRKETEVEEFGEISSYFEEKEKEKEEAKIEAEPKEFSNISALFEQKEEQGTLDVQEESSGDESSKSLNRNEYAAFENGGINYEDCIVELYSSVLGNQEPSGRKSISQGE